MGTLIGHILPGVFFFVFGLIGIFDGFKRYFYALTRGKTPYRSQTCTKYRYKDRKTNMTREIPLESILKASAALIGVVGEVVTGMTPEGIVGIHNQQHCIMYCLFGIQGMVEILVHRMESSHGANAKVLPPNLDYIFGAMAFAGETLLFYWHLHGRNELDIRVHTFLIYVSLACVIFCIVELVNRSDFSIFLLRNGFTIIHGTWFVHVGFILYPISDTAHWDPSSHRDLMTIPIYFILHIMATSSLIGILGFLFYGYNYSDIKEIRYFEVKSSSSQRIPLTSSSESDLNL
uniref:Transmembrane protein 45B n=1 Tax=Caligus clemensi TaxID=344056 RepID=C1C380_CALCM|nr:Transmembrane protein 45B [Caligus clemensi]